MKITRIIALFFILIILTSCGVQPPQEIEYTIDPLLKIVLIVACSLICAGLLGYGIYTIVKKYKKKK